MHRRRIQALAVALAAVSAVAGTARAQAAQANTAFTLSNASAGNRVIVFDRGSGGRLYRVGSVGTGGRGTGVNLGSEGALALSPDGRRLYAVNTASDTGRRIRRLTAPTCAAIAVVPSAAVPALRTASPPATEAGVRAERRLPPERRRLLGDGGRPALGSWRAARGR